MYLLDTNVLLEAQLGQARQQESLALLERLQQGAVQAVISDFQIDSILLILEREGHNRKIMQDFLLSLSLYQGLRIYFLSLLDRLKALEHADHFGIDFEDAIAVQACVANGIKEIVSFDRHFDKVKILKRIYPREAK